jgi:leucine-rich repeat-containing protein 49
MLGEWQKLENLDVVPNLRVLMMGKNRLKVIENLECLKKLDVLDLHRCDCHHQLRSP